MLTLPPKRRGREQAACWQLLRFAAGLTRPDGTSARVSRQPGPVETTHPHRTEPSFGHQNPSTGADSGPSRAASSSLRLIARWSPGLGSPGGPSVGCGLRLERWPFRRGEIAPTGTPGVPPGEISAGWIARRSRRGTQGPGARGLGARRARWTAMDREDRDGPLPTPDGQSSIRTGTGASRPPSSGTCISGSSRRLPGTNSAATTAIASTPAPTHTAGTIPSTNACGLV